MRRLIDRRGRDRGAVAATVAVVFALFALTGVAALTVDAGSLYAERRVVQNGADAASIALAQACARGEVAKCSASWSDLTTLANLNSPDGVTDIASVCGPGLTVETPCVTPSPPLTGCLSLPASLPAAVEWVEVRTTTRSTTANPSVVRKWFADLSNPSYQGSSVQACARAGWGAPSSVRSALPITISVCEFNAITSNGADLKAPGPYTTYPSPAGFPYESAIKFHTQSESNCPQGPSGADTPGGFGYLNNEGCNATASAIGQVPVRPGNPSNTALGCDFTSKLSATTGEPVFLPIYSSLIDTEYTMDGVAAFWLTGFSTSGNRHASDASGRQMCTPSETCLYGWFVSDMIPFGSFGGGGTGTPRGALVVGVAG